RLDPLPILLRERDGSGFRVLLQISNALRAGDGDDVLALRKHPGERQLSRRNAFLLRDLLDLLDQIQVALEVLALKARRAPAIVVFRQVLEPLEPARQEPAPQGTVGDEADAQFAYRIEHAVLLHVARPE